MVAEPVTRAAEAEQDAGAETQDLEEGRALLRELDGDGGTDPDSEAQGQQAEHDDEEPDEFTQRLEAARAAAREEGKTLGRKERESELESENRKHAETQRSEELNQRYIQRIQAFDSDDAIRELMDLGVGERDAQHYLGALKGIFNAHHQDAIRYSADQVKKGLAESYVAAVVGGAGKHLPAAIGKSIAEKVDEFKSTEELVGAIVAGARDGYLTKAQADDLAAEKLVKYRQKGEKEGWITARGRGPGDRGSGAASGRKSFEQLRAGYGAGTNSDAEDAEYLRQRADREKAGG